jgi:ABC-type uncharacterized transport system substrate-binding protein
MMRRREFITLLGGAAAVLGTPVRAQQRERIRRIGVLKNLAADDPVAALRSAVFAQALSELGWTVGRNLSIDFRWAAGDADRYRQYAAELAALPLEVILAEGTAAAAALQAVTRSVPIVLVGASDPVGAGLITILARPGGNLTGFTTFEYGFSGKWLELLKQVAPAVTRAAFLRDPSGAAGIAQLAAIQSVAPLFGVELRPLDARDAVELERTLPAFAERPNGGLIVSTSGRSLANRTPIIALAARHRLPAVYPARYFVTEGGLVSYGAPADQHRRAAGYVDRILKGEKPADLPVQAPTKYELVINMKTAKALGLDIPATVLARADEVIE